MAKSSDAEHKGRLYEAIGRVALALGSAGRLQILEFVAQGERGVDTLAAMTGLSVANTSKHLQALRQAVESGNYWPGVDKVAAALVSHMMAAPAA